MPSGPEAGGVERWTVDRFAPLQGETFLLDAEGWGALPVTLTQVRALPHPAYEGRTPFSLLFDAPAHPVLPQRIYRLAHSSLPALEVFLVPVADGPGRLAYEAVFA